MYVHAYTLTNAQSSCKPFNVATQWGSVSNAALDFSHGNKESFVSASDRLWMFEPDPLV